MTKKDGISTWAGRAYTHRTLMASAKAFLHAADDRTSKLRDHHALAATLFAWLAFEAYLNTCVEHLDPAVYRDERQYFRRRGGVIGKLDWTLGKLAVPLTPSAEKRRRTIVRLRALRDRIVHAKPAAYSGRMFHPLDQQRPFMQPGWVEREVTVAAARRYVAAVRDLGEWINRNMRLPHADPHLRRSAFDGVLQSETGTTARRLPRR